jgi:uncharacterized protein
MFEQLIHQKLSIAKHQVVATVKLLEGGATIPFISRYRKEVTGSLDEVDVAEINAELKRFKDIDKRRETILASLKEQGIKNLQLISSIKSCWELSVLEDLYLPYKPKRKTRASMARERGLAPLAEVLMQQNEHNIEKRAKAFLNNEVPDAEAALAGARDIIAEKINEDAKAREAVRRLFEKNAVISSRVIERNKAKGAKYKDYFEFTQSLKKCPSHRLLAMRRAEQESILRVSIGIDAEDALEKLDRMFLKNNGPSAAQVNLAMEDCYKRLLGPSIETEFRKLSKVVADQEAIGVFSENLRQLLLAAPLGQKPTMAIDPGFKSGCKLVCINALGDLLENTTIFPHPPQRQVYDATEIVQELIHKHGVEAVAVGNGTAGRETEKFVQSAIGKSKVEVFMVNESGASIYSASKIARDEFPDLDLTVRGAISIGRRLMDPLAELVKIDAKSIGVGQYQHDVDQGSLKESLDQVVSSAVNQVGVNINTASQHLLRYVSGIGPTLAKNIVKYRNENGAFSSRKELKKVKGLGDKAFEQSAGFLRIPNASHPLDNSAVHPESYQIVEKMAKDLSQPIDQLIERQALRQKIKVHDYVTPTTGLPTLKDIMKELEKPGLDPRGKAETFSFAEGIMEMKDLRTDMRLPGVITNLTKFGAFVDIGIKENGLIHISQITNRFIKDPAEVLKLDQKVMVRVVEVDMDRKRIHLSMKD